MVLGSLRRLLLLVLGREKRGRCGLGGRCFLSNSSRKWWREKHFWEGREVLQLGKKGVSIRCLAYVNKQESTALLFTSWVHRFVAFMSIRGVWRCAQYEQSGISRCSQLFIYVLRHSSYWTCDTFPSSVFWSIMPPKAHLPRRPDPYLMNNLFCV